MERGDSLTIEASSTGSGDEEVEAILIDKEDHQKKAVIEQHQPTTTTTRLQSSRAASLLDAEVDDMVIGTVEDDDDDDDDYYDDTEGPAGLELVTDDDTCYTDSSSKLSSSSSQSCFVLNVVTTNDDTTKPKSPTSQADSPLARLTEQMASYLVCSAPNVDVVANDTNNDYVTKIRLSQSTASLHQNNNNNNDSFQTVLCAIPCGAVPSGIYCSGQQQAAAETSGTPTQPQQPSSPDNKAARAAAAATADPTTNSTSYGCSDIAMSNLRQAVATEFTCGVSATTEGAGEWFASSWLESKNNAAAAAVITPDDFMIGCAAAPTTTFQPPPKSRKPRNRSRSGGQQQHKRKKQQYLGHLWSKWHCQNTVPDSLPDRRRAKSEDDLMAVMVRGDDQDHHSDLCYDSDPELFLRFKFHQSTTTTTSNNTTKRKRAAAAAATISNIELAVAKSTPSSPSCRKERADSIGSGCSTFASLDERPLGTPSTPSCDSTSGSDDPIINLFRPKTKKEAIHMEYWDDRGEVQVSLLLCLVSARKLQFNEMVHSHVSRLSHCVSTETLYATIHTQISPTRRQNFWFIHTRVFSKERCSEQQPQQHTSLSPVLV